jgi:hypothetical protein
MWWLIIFFSPGENSLANIEALKLADPAYSMKPVCRQPLYASLFDPADKIADESKTF